MKRVIFIFILLSVCRGYGQGLVFKSDGTGVSFLSYNNTVLFNKEQKIGVPFNNEPAKVIHKGGKAEMIWPYPTSTQKDVQPNTYKYIYDLLQMLCQYRQVKDTLFITVTVTNTSSKSDTLAGINIIPFQLQFPQRPSGFQQYVPYYHYNLDGPTIIPADFGTGKMVLDNEDFDNAVFVGLQDVNMWGGPVNYKVWVSAIPFNGMQTQNIPNLEKKLAPGQSVTYHLALRFYPSGTSDEAVASVVVNKFRSKLKAAYSWPDRRPMGALFLSSVAKQNVITNPRGFMPSISNISIKDVNGLAELRKQVMAYAQRSISILKDMNAQGMITWDIEGQEFAHPTSYVGSPDKIGQVAPEMDAIADEYFALFKTAGLKTGICVRPQEFILNKDGKSAIQQDVKDPAAVLIRKIKYARKRWGCTLFYVDSNVDGTGALMDAGVFKKVHEAIPDVLLIPEQQDMKYFEFTAPFEEMRFGGRMVDGVTHAVYPSSFFVLTVGEAIVDASGKRLISDDILKKSVQQGNVFLFRAWFDDQPTNGIVKKIYSEVNKSK